MLRQIYPQPRREYFWGPRSLRDQILHRNPTDPCHLIGIRQNPLVIPRIGPKYIHHFVFNHAAADIGAVFHLAAMRQIQPGNPQFLP